MDDSLALDCGATVTRTGEIPGGGARLSFTRSKGEFHRFPINKMRAAEVLV